MFTVLYLQGSRGFPGGSEVKASACNAGDPGSIPGLGRSPGEGNGNPLHILAWRIPWTEVPGGLQSMGSQRVAHIWATNTHIMENCEPSPIFQTRVSAQSSAHWLKGKTASSEEDFAVPIRKYMQYLYLKGPIEGNTQLFQGLLDIGTELTVIIMGKIPWQSPCRVRRLEAWW